MIRRLVICLAAILITLPVWACMCPGAPTHEASRAKADAIFEGVIVEKRVVMDYSQWSGWYAPVDAYELAVVQVWKGEPQRRITLIGGTSGCSRHFAAGHRYVIYAVRHERKGKFRDLDCGTSHRVRPERGPTAAYMGAPLATFAEPSSLPSKTPPRLYRHRAQVVAGAAVLANVVTKGSESTERMDPAPVGIVVSGTLCMLVPLVGVATSFGKARRAAVLFALAIALLYTTLTAAGRIIVADPRNPAELVWPLTYTIPESVDL